MSENAKGWIRALIPSIVAVILFFVLNAIVNPSRAVADQVSDHESRLRVEEKTTLIIEDQMKDINRKLDKIIDLHIGDKK